MGVHAVFIEVFEMQQIIWPSSFLIHSRRVEAGTNPMADVRAGTHPTACDL